MTTFAERTPCTSVHLSNTSRVKVDPGQTGFFENREMRSFYEFSLAAGASAVVRMQCPVNMILEEFNIMLTREEIRAEVVSGGTPAGSFSTPLPVFPANGMTDAPAYTPVTTIDTGGTHTGGIVRDIIRVLAGSNASNSQVVVIASDSPVGRAPVPLYIRINNPSTGTAVGIMKLRWEERP